MIAVSALVTLGVSRLGVRTLNTARYPQRDPFQNVAAAGRCRMTIQMSIHVLPLTQLLAENPRELRRKETQRHLPRTFAKRPPEAKHAHRCGPRGRRVVLDVLSRE